MRKSFWLTKVVILIVWQTWKKKINALRFWFASSEFKCLYLVAGDIYLHCDSLGEVGELDDVVRVTGDGLVGGTV